MKRSTYRAKYGSLIGEKVLNLLRRVFHLSNLVLFFKKIEGFLLQVKVTYALCARFLIGLWFFTLVRQFIKLISLKISDKIRSFS